MRVTPLVDLLSDSEVDIISNDGKPSSGSDVTMVGEKSQSDNSITADELDQISSNSTITMIQHNNDNMRLPTSESTVVCATVLDGAEVAGSDEMECNSNVDNDNIIEIVQLPSTSLTSDERREYLEEYDPFIDELIGDPIGTYYTALNGLAVGGHNETSEALGNSLESPQPCSSRSCFSTTNRKRFCSDESASTSGEKSPSKQLRLNKDKSKNCRGKNSVENPSISGESDDESVTIKRRGHKAQIVSSESDKSSSSLFEAVKAGKKRKKLTKKREKTSKNFSKVKQKASEHSDVSSSEADDAKDPDQGQTSSSEEEDSKSSEETRCRGTRRSRRNSRVNQSKQEGAFIRLREQVEKRKNKPKRQSPERIYSENKKDESESHDSSYTSGSSPCPVVDEPSSPDGSDFDCSTPSSSSVTSSGITDEEPDLEIGGSDGEKEIKTENLANDSDEDDESVKSHTSSSEGDPPDDGQNDQRCILCKNLGPSSIQGRSTSKNNDWCKCGRCRTFSPLCRDYDLICCREIKAVVDFVDEELEENNVCITEHSRFDSDVLQNEGYARSISKHKEPRRWGGSYWGNFYESYTCGKSDYRKYDNAKRKFEEANPYGKMVFSMSSYLHWIFDQLGQERGQMVIPACVQDEIRERFEIPSKVFCPFRAKQVCPIRRHCLQSKSGKSNTTVLDLDTD